MGKQYFVYIMTNHHNKVLYAGVTGNHEKRVFEHTHKLVKGFTSRYNVTKLVYFETTGDVESAILREKQIKGMNRNKKLALKKPMNPEWQDLIPKY